MQVAGGAAAAVAQQAAVEDAGLRRNRVLDQSTSYDASVFSSEK